jgi:hypothetical protein
VVKTSKEGLLLWAFKRIYSSRKSEISQQVSSLGKKNSPANLACFFGPAFSAPKNQPFFFGREKWAQLFQPSDGCCMWPEFDLPLLHSTAQVWPLLAAQIWPRTRPLCLSCSLFFSCPSNLFLFSQMRMCAPLTLNPSIYLSNSLFQETSRSFQPEIHFCELLISEK